MLNSVRALLDANILYSNHLRNLLLQIAQNDLFDPKWSALIEEEWLRNMEPRTRRAYRTSHSPSHPHLVPWFPGSLMRGLPGSIPHAQPARRMSRIGMLPQRQRPPLRAYWSRTIGDISIPRFFMPEVWSCDPQTSFSATSSKQARRRWRLSHTGSSNEPDQNLPDLGRLPRFLSEPLQPCEVCRVASNVTKVRRRSVSGQVSGAIAARGIWARLRHPTQVRG